MMLLKLSAISTQANRDYFPTQQLSYLTVEVSKLQKGKEVKIYLCSDKVNLSELH